MNFLHRAFSILLLGMVLSLPLIIGGFSVAPNSYGCPHCTIATHLLG